MINTILGRCCARLVSNWRRLWISCLFAGLASLLWVGESQAVFIVTPNNAATTEGNSNNGNAFSIDNDSYIPSNSQRYQQIYNATLFSGVPTGGAYITQISFRPDGVSGHTFSATIPDIRIDLSTSGATESNFNRYFANNVGSDDTIVYGGSTGGPLQLSSSDTGPAGGPANFDIVINLTTPFLYNPTKGSLLLDVRDYEGATLSVFDAVNTAGDGIASLFTDAGGVNAISDDASDTIGYVTGFTFVPVPEPAGSWILLSLASWILTRRTSTARRARLLESPSSGAATHGSGASFLGNADKVTR